MTPSIMHRDGSKSIKNGKKNCCHKAFEGMIQLLTRNIAHRNVKTVLFFQTRSMIDILQGPKFASDL